MFFTPPGGHWLTLSEWRPQPGLNRADLNRDPPEKRPQGAVMTTLHLGTLNPDSLIALLPNRDAIIFMDGDSWEEWGEMDYPTNVPDHVIIRTVDQATGVPELLSDVAFIMAMSPGLLVPMKHPHQAGTLAVISSDDDWNDQAYVLVDERVNREVLTTAGAGVQR